MIFQPSEDAGDLLGSEGFVIAGATAAHGQPVLVHESDQLVVSAIGARKRTILRAAVGHLRPRGAAPRHEDNPEREMQDLRALIVARPVGIIITPTAHPSQDTLDLLTGVRAVQLVRQQASIRSEAVVMDEHGAIASSARHLIDYGHKDIAYIGVLSELTNGAERLAGFVSTMHQAGLDPSKVALMAPRPEFSRHAVHTLMSATRRPTALVMGSSSLTFGALMALRALGMRWPEDISIVGYGDPVWFGLIGDGLTTMKLPVEEMGRYIVGVLLPAAGDGFDKTAGSAEGAPPQASRFAPSLVIRRSTRVLSAA